jgi:murein DD-endopeptidase MepM/ murein hydrolase activator NlpD
MDLDEKSVALIAAKTISPGKRNPLYDFITECSDASTGEVSFNAAGCTLAAKGESYIADAEGGSPSVSALEAIPVFLLDYQISSMMSDDDDEEAATNDSTGVDGDGSSAEDGSTSGGAIDAASKDGWIWPMQKNIRSGPCYGRPGEAGVHAGLDINSSYSQSVYAAHDGEVVWAKWYRAGGNAVRIKTPEGIYYTYQHLSSYSVKAGQQVKAGQVVGVGGLTGNVSVNPATKVHLHIVASRSNDDPSYGSLKNSFDPLTLLPKPAPNNYTCTK